MNDGDRGQSDGWVEGRILLQFLRVYPRRSVLLVVLLAGSGLAEGFGLLTLLPLFQTAVTGSAAEGAAERAVLEVVDRLGLDPTAAVLLTLIVVALWVKGVLRWLAMRQVGDTVARVARDLRLGLTRSLLAARWRHVGVERAGAIATSLGRDAIWASHAYRHACAALAAAIQVAVYAAVVALVSWEVGVLGLAGALLLMVLLGRFVRMSRGAGAEQTERARSLASGLLEVVGALKVIRGMGREQAYLGLLERETSVLEAAERRQVLAVESLHAFQEPLLALMLAPLVYIALTAGLASFSTLLVGVFLIHRLIVRTHQVQSEYQGIAAAAAALRAVAEQTRAAEAEREPEWGARPAPRVEREIELRDVTVRLGRRAVLDGISLRIPARGITAVVGPSGVGKTTLLDLLLGLGTPTAGTILVDGVPLGEVDRAAWRASIGYLPQDPVILHDTVARNLSLGVEQVNPSALRRALREAEILDLVESLPAGLETVLEGGGVTLSGGERQRIALARSLLLRPRLLILDEPTSELDVSSEVAIWRTIARLARDTTVVAASHRPAVLEVADVVLSLRPDEAPVLRPRGGREPATGRSA